MSFSISFTGQGKEDAVAKVSENLDNQPNGQPFQSTIESAINALPDLDGNVEINVSANGHVEILSQGNGESYVNISVRQVSVAAGDPSAELREAVPPAA